MIPNMFQHQIDAQLKRYRRELRLYQVTGQTEHAEHVMRRIESWERLRPNAPKATFAPGQPQEFTERLTLEEILAEFRPY